MKKNVQFIIIIFLLLWEVFKIELILRFTFFRRLRALGRYTHRKYTGEISVRAGGIRQESVPQPTHAVRQTSPEAPVSSDGQCASHRAIVLRPVGRENSDWNTHQRHASKWRFIQLVIYDYTVTSRKSNDRALLITTHTQSFQNLKTPFFPSFLKGLYKKSHNSLQNIVKKIFYIFCW